MIWGPEQVISAPLSTQGEKNITEIKYLHQVLFFGRTRPAVPENRGGNAGKEAAQLRQNTKALAPKTGDVAVC
jgi:hypothetical protein